MLSIGNFIFGIIGQIAPNKRSRKKSWNWAENEVIEKMNVLQYTGKSPDKIKIPGVIYPGQIGKIDSLKPLHEMADAGEPYVLVDAAGWVHGKWVIISINEKQSYLTYTSAPQKIEFDIELKKYES